LSDVNLDGTTKSWDSLDIMMITIQTTIDWWLRLQTLGISINQKLLTTPRNVNPSTDSYIHTAHILQEQTAICIASDVDSNKIPTFYSLAVSSSGLSGKGPEVADNPGTVAAGVGAGARVDSAAAVVVVGVETGAVTAAGAAVGSGAFAAVVSGNASGLAECAIYHMLDTIIAYQNENENGFVRVHRHHGSSQINHEIPIMAGTLQPIILW
jgi:hypothetical protein